MKKTHIWNSDRFPLKLTGEKRNNISANGSMCSQLTFSHVACSRSSSTCSSGTSSLFYHECLQPVTSTATKIIGAMGSDERPILPFLICSSPFENISIPPVVIDSLQTLTMDKTRNKYGFFVVGPNRYHVVGVKFKFGTLWWTPWWGFLSTTLEVVPRCLFLKRR